METLEMTIERMKRDLSQKRSKQGLTQSSADLTTTDICPICHGEEWIPVRIDGVDYMKPCECRERAIMERRLKFANLPDAFRGMKLNSFRTDVYRKPESKVLIATACKTVKCYLDNFEDMREAGMGLYLYSQTKGSGKTRMAAGIANELMKKYPVRFAGSTTILKEIKRSWDREKRKKWDQDESLSESQLLDELSLADILIIDDFGTESAADWINDKFYQIINDRYVNNKVTIFTSNESLDSLKYDDRITNRIKERTYQISFPEESVREYIAEKNKNDMIERLQKVGRQDG